MTIDSRLSLLNDFWTSFEDFNLKRPFVFAEGRFDGEIELKATSKDDLRFWVHIPLSYPLSNDAISIRFYCLNATGYRHMNADNSICLIVPKRTDFNERLKEEAKLLTIWRDKYYLGNETDERYEYPIISFANNNSFLFTDSSTGFHPGQYGDFFAVRYADNGDETFESKNYIVQKFDASVCQFSGPIVNQPPMLKGLYYFIDKEPLSNGRIGIENWSDFNALMSQRYKQYLNELSTSPKTPDDIFLMVGYYIPGTTETHWLCAKMNKKSIPVKSIRISPGSYEYHLQPSPVNYCKTFNCSYERFFGRGCLSENFRNQKVLIMGIGAVGSALAKILVRTGIKHLFVSDFERVEPGNICRSEYSLKNVSEMKWLALLKELVVISPFVEVGNENILSKIIDEPFQSEELKKLNQYDMIFDCTSDMEIAYYLDKILPETKIYNFSLSNEAKELVCVTGERNIAGEKNLLFGKLNQNEDLMFYEGTGCWSPTFKASYFDINALINLAVKKIDYQLAGDKPLNTFVVQYQIDQTTFNLTTIDY
jgi:hypothetical protein